MLCGWRWARRHLLRQPIRNNEMSWPRGETVQATGVNTCGRSLDAARTAPAFGSASCPNSDPLGAPCPSWGASPDSFGRGMLPGSGCALQEGSCHNPRFLHTRQPHSSRKYIEAAALDPFQQLGVNRDQRPQRSPAARVNQIQQRL